MTQRIGKTRRSGFRFKLGCASIIVLSGCVSVSDNPGLSSSEVKGSIRTAMTAVTVTVKRAEELEFQPLNPARGDASPQAGVLWGDITENVPSGVLLKFADGFSSPPHIHNITYRAVVISGQLHNDDPNAANFWMGPGSYWTQPAGELHITSARPGSGATAFLEILSGPYLVQPASDAFDSGQRPINQDAKNRVWLDSSVTHWIEDSWTEYDSARTPSRVARAQFAPLWGNLTTGELSGSMLRLPPQFSGSLTAAGSTLRGVVIQGTITHEVESYSNPQALAPGSLFASTGKVSHNLECGGRECLVYVRAEGPYRLRANH